MKRTLSLTREALSELTTGELASVVGAAPLSGVTCPVVDCLDNTQGVVCLDLTRSCA